MQLSPNSDETIVGASNSIASGEVSSERLVERCLTRIDEREADVRAWVSVDRDGAIDAARALDAERKTGRNRGPLHGIPVGIKDIIDVAGFPTAAGSALLAETAVDEDAEVVRRLRAAGAVILGKTVTTQFACYDPPVTRNPWDLDRTPGGSSSGSAAAVADGMCFAAIGSQTGGSITRPASFCGIAGCKPSFGRVSRRGVVPIAEHLDHVGPLCRTVSDLAIVLDAIAGYDPLDPYSIQSSAPIVGLHRADPVADPPRLGRLQGFFEEHASGESNAAIDSFVVHCETHGAWVENVELPAAFADVTGFHRVVMAVEGAAFHQERFARFPDDYLPGIRTLIEEGLATSVTEYVRARGHQTRLQREMLRLFADVDVLVCPATVAAAPDLSTTGDPVLNSPWSDTGLPTVSFPVSLNTAGLPLAVQLAGRPFGESGLFAAGTWCEGTLAR